MTCNAKFILSGYLSPDDDGSGTLYQLTDSDGGPQISVAGGTAIPCGVVIPDPPFCSADTCAPTTTFLRSWKTVVSVPVSILGTIHCKILGIAINPSGVWYLQAFTCDFSVIRGGVTVFTSGGFTEGQPSFFGGLMDLTSLNPLNFQMRPGDTLLVNVYVVLSFRGCRTDDGNRPTLTHGGGGAFADARGVLEIPRIAPDPLSPTEPYAPGAYAARLFPNLSCQAWPVLKRYVYATDVRASAGARENRVGSWTAPLMEWELSYDVARSGTVLGTAYTEFEQLIGFYTGRRGQLQRFVFDDVTDNQVVDEPLGTGDGTQTAFVLSRTLGAHTAPIGRVNAIVNVKVAGVATPNYTIAGNVLTFTTAPSAGQVLTWSGSYYWVARFADPDVEFGNFANRLWELKKVRLRQLRV